MTPVLIQLPSADVLAGPDESLPSVDPGSPPVPVTGGGLLAVLDPGTGLRGLFRGEERISGQLEVTVDGMPIPGSARLRAGKGGWSRSIPLSEGGSLTETGFQGDAPAATVLQWTLRAGSGNEGRSSPAAVRRLEVRLSLPGQARPITADLPVSLETPATVAILPDADQVDRLLGFLRSLRSRERLRANRRPSKGAAGIAFLLDGRAIPSLERALLALEDAPIGARPGGEPLPPFLAGLTGEAPCYLDAAGTSELGTAALGAGWRPVARAALEFLGSSEASALPLLHLLADWAAWTGDVQLMGPLRPALERAAREAGGIRIPTNLATLRDALPPRPIPVGAQELAIALGAPGPEDPSAIAAARTLAAAGTIREWVEHRLGALPDAAFGRLRIAPVVTGEWSSLEAHGLRVGDACVQVGCLRTERSVSFQVTQVEGRVPLNLVFEPILHDLDIERVLIGGQPADVQILPEGRGSRLRCQFPLDQEREITALVREA
ncbi:MAG: hypothetical protein EXR92_02390 [Gemmatimonadetes bacterium]|nr:hypothetical protein [Gemmatimonadota bacterium]